jgi:hypothetical protein
LSARSDVGLREWPGAPREPRPERASALQERAAAFEGGLLTPVLSSLPDEVIEHATAMTRDLSP